MNMIELQHVTKDYGKQKGIFDVSFALQKGEAAGFIGTNGAGKTTTLRHLMGFIKPNTGSVNIMGMDCFSQADRLQTQIGYLPGEIAFMDTMSGEEFLRFMADMKRMKDLQYARELADWLQLDTHVKIKKMSKGMKQKLGLIIAFMQDAPILLLDEPTSGLDPIMQGSFIELIRREKAKGKTILMSSHIFEEIEQACDRIIMIKEGHIVADETMEQIKSTKKRQYELVFATVQDARLFQRQYPDSTIEGTCVSVALNGELKEFLYRLSKLDILDISMRQQTLEDLFLQYYGGK